MQENTQQVTDVLLHSWLTNGSSKAALGFCALKGLNNQDFSQTVVSGDSLCKTVWAAFIVTDQWACRVHRFQGGRSPKGALLSVKKLNFLSRRKKKAVTSSVLFIVLLYQLYRDCPSIRCLHMSSPGKLLVVHHRNLARFSVLFLWKLLCFERNKVREMFCGRDVTGKAMPEAMVFVPQNQSCVVTPRKLLLSTGRERVSVVCLQTCVCLIDFICPCSVIPLTWHEIHADLEVR